MNISSMARKNIRTKEQNRIKSSKSFGSTWDYSALPDAPNLKVSKICKSSGVMITGLQQNIEERPRLHRTNSERPIRSRSSLKDHKRTKSAKIMSTPRCSYDEFYEAKSEHSGDELEETSNWYLDPIHRRTHYESPFTIRTQQDVMRSEELDDLELSFSKIRESGDALIRRNDRIQSSISPYEMELYRLRYEKLKIEEAYLLKLKCEAELERTRGPKAKWYELKTKEFTTEMEKYANLMRSKNRWNELMSYRDNLKNVSGLWSDLKN